MHSHGVHSRPRPVLLLVVTVVDEETVEAFDAPLELWTPAAPAPVTMRRLMAAATLRAEAVILRLCWFPFMGFRVQGHVWMNE